MINRKDDNFGKRMIPEPDLNYLQTLKKEHEDPTAPWGGGSDYTAGTGIDITEDVISVDTETVALKTDIPAAVSGTNDGTNWTTITIGNDTYAISQGGSSMLVIDIDSSDTSVTQDQFNSIANNWPNVIIRYANTDSQNWFYLPYYENIGSPNNSYYFIYNSATTVNTKKYIASKIMLIGHNGGITKKEISVTNDYDDLIDKPTIPTDTSDLTNSAGFITSSALTGYATESWVSTQGYLTSVSWSDVSNKPTFATVATSGDYDDLINKPTIPVVPTNVSSFNNDAGYITSSALSGYATESWVSTQGYITGIDSSDVITALGYTPGTSNFSGSYTDLTDKPDLSIYAESSNLATVATTGDYTDLLNKPTIPTVDYPVTDVQVNGTSVLSNKVASVSVPTTATSTSTSSVTPSTIQLTFTYSDNTTETVTLMTGASVSTTTTTTLS